MSEIKITHLCGPNACRTTLEMPGRPPISKSWRRAGSSEHHSWEMPDERDWSEEGLDDELVRGVDDPPLDLCDLLAEIEQNDPAGTKAEGR